MNRIISFPDVWNDLVIYVAIPQYRFWLIFLAVFFSACCVYCLPKQFVHHLLPPLQKCNNLRDHGHLYKLPDMWLPNSPDLNPIDYKIWVIIQQRVQSTKVQSVKDLMQRLIDAWAGVEENIQNVNDHRCRRRHTCIQPQNDIMNIHCDRN